MKRFIVFVLSVSVFFIGLGSLVEKAGARIKSDERALELLRAARIAVGGEGAIGGVKSMSVTGQTTQTFNINGQDHTEQGETEIALLLTGKLMKTVKIGHEDGTVAHEKVMKRHVEMVVDAEGDSTSPNGVKRIIVKTPDGSTEELSGEQGKKIIIHKGDSEQLEWKTENGDKNLSDERHVMVRHHGEEEQAARQNELFRLTLSLLLSAPEGLDVSYLYAGEGSVDGTPCNVIEAQASGSSVKLFLGKDSNLPVMISYIGRDFPRMMRFDTKVPEGANADKDAVVFTRKIEAPESGEVQVRFSDYRNVGGLQMPYRWSKTVNGKLGETFEVANYELNPANIEARFQNHNVMWKMKKADGQ